MVQHCVVELFDEHLSEVVEHNVVRHGEPSIEYLSVGMHLHFSILCSTMARALQSVIVKTKQGH